MLKYSRDPNIVQPSCHRNTLWQSGMLIPTPSSSGSPPSQVMATLQSALADPHGTSAQCRAAYRVMMGYILGLSDACLAENLSTIVVSGISRTGQ